ncbi:4-hydroxy-tetrahydrodipicolinate reductase [Bacillus benzoevorans]|uniref:4-hydroxy-tetrahydrodipicolinate reductase n=1 Tax=Bacillus benzoevorans TaxID=1456 RepID=UPI00160FA276|nr:4-hydroxy-tetrahydrodipicolinate reductase [Bacillus benzoevorans]
MTNIVICGSSGKMGKVIHNIISTRDNCKVVAGIDKYTEDTADFPVVATPNLLSSLSIEPDVIIDFSHPSVLDELLDYCLTNRVALVIATTGYSQEEVEKIHQAAKEIPLFFTANMSLGVNLLAELAKKAVAILGDQFDIEIVEKHHNQKIDAPSGTALMLADEINEELDHQYTYTYDRHSVREKRTKKEIGLHAIRGGTIVGDHDIIFAGRDEILTLSHHAASKEVFAVGAVNASLFLKGKEPGLYNMKDLISF